MNENALDIPFAFFRLARDESPKHALMRNCREQLTDSRHMFVVFNFAAVMSRQLPDGLCVRTRCDRFSVISSNLPDRTTLRS